MCLSSCCAIALHPTKPASTHTTIHPTLSQTSNVFNAGALQRAFFEIAIASCSSVSNWTSMSFLKIRNRVPPPLHTHGSMISSKCNALEMPCTRYDSRIRANPTPGLPSSLAAIFLLPHRQTRPLLPHSSTSQITLQMWWLQLSPHRQVRYRGSGAVP